MRKDSAINSSMYHFMNNDDFYKIVKLKTGEIILCAMPHDVKSVAGETHLCLIEPVQVIPHHQTRKTGKIVGESFFLRPWMGMSDNDEFVISTDIVLTIGDLKKEVKTQYVNYITQVIETKRKKKQRDMDEEAIFKLLTEVTPGEVRIVDDEDIDDDFLFYEDDDYGEGEER